ncbi:uncharacterized protein [Drosophila tropicalis]|uniref:uncharacterized protein n=1 Tax=Drosophila tropicalis TaxID=46794 RepID=UPI0035ABE985
MFNLFSVFRSAVESEPKPRWESFIEKAEDILEKCWFGLAHFDGETTRYVFGYIFVFGFVFAWIVFEIYTQWTGKQINKGRSFWFQMNSMSVVELDENQDAVSAGNQRTISAQTSVSLKEKHFSMCIHNDAPQSEEQLDDTEWETLSDTTTKPTFAKMKTDFDFFDAKGKSSNSMDDQISRIPVMVREATFPKIKLTKKIKRRFY